MGDWVKGANMLAFISIVLVIAISYLLSIVIHMALRLISNFQMSKGKTVCKLAESALRYLTMFVTVFFVFYYLGFPVSTILGSIGIVSIALSLGATGLVSDIIAGLAIVFEHCFQVGDIISIGDNKGVVQEIGIRTTKLMTGENDLIVINNSSIGTITNHTRKPSSFFMEFSIPIETPLEPVEELLRRELPELGKKCDEIIGEPIYVGVTKFGSKNGYAYSNVQTLGIVAICSAKDLYVVNNYLCREILLLLRDAGFETR